MGNVEKKKLIDTPAPHVYCSPLRAFRHARFSRNGRRFARRPLATPNPQPNANGVAGFLLRTSLCALTMLMIGIMSVTHLAGVPINIGGRVIQRCSICGEKLIDSKGVMVLMSDERPMHVWSVGELIQFDGAMELPVNAIDGKLPSDSCVEMVEW